VGPANIGIFEIIIYFNNNYILRSLLRIEIIFWIIHKLSYW
jgi:hypothetical protein